MIETIVTNEDYLQYSGIDLNIELSSKILNDLGDDPAPRFIYQIESYVKDYLQENYAFNGILKEGNQKERFKQGILAQIGYILENVDFTKESGFNPSTGQLIPRRELERITLAPNAVLSFRLGGLMNFRRY